MSPSLPSQPTTARASSPGAVRAVSEWIVLLALAVTLFRCFGVESYMISTGSMAPCLLGYHTRITCPACALTFAHGVPLPAGDAGESRSARMARAQSIGIGNDWSDTVACPNCSRVCRTGANAVATEGDQLLVHKDAFAWRQLAGRGGPRRWEIIVFRSPDDSQMAYVKRVTGLPGEKIELRDGDVYADGRLQRKSLTAQLSTRIPVSLSDFPATDDDPDSEPRWMADSGSAWTRSGAGFEFVPRAAGAIAPGQSGPGSAWDWMTYRQWIRSGGATSTSVSLAKWPDDLQRPDPFLSPLEFDPEQQRLKCLGALPHAEWERWDTATADAAFQGALWNLFRESHVVPLTDASSYNPPGIAPLNLVHDLQLELTLEWRSGNGMFAIEMTDGAREFRAELDLGRRELRTIAEGDEVLQTVPVDLSRGSPVVLTMSTFDQQLLLAVDGEPLGEPFPYDRHGEELVPLRRPVRFGAKDAAVAVSHVALYRDIFYTPAPDRETQVFAVDADEYFVLGDNSSVSIDSRNWQHAGIPEASLIGKPLFVHLPSRPLRLEWGGRTRQIRVPDFERIRYIH